MASKTQQCSIAKSVLSHIPEPERGNVVREAILAVEPDSEASEVGLAISLLGEHPDAQSRNVLLAHLEASLATAKLQHVELVCSLDKELRHDALDRAVIQLAAVANSYLGPHSEHQAVRMEELFECECGSENDQDVSLVPLLQFTKSAALFELGVHSLIGLFRSTLILMGSADKHTCSAARETFTIVFTGATAITVDDDLVWKCIQTFIAHTVEEFYPRLGYNLWLRWASSQHMIVHSWFDQDYWRLLREGLQDGDTECRKQCLGILRRSVVDASGDPLLCYMVCSQHELSIDPGMVIDNYDRFLTVFKTIVLGRYLNQVVACESDLNLLASAQSFVKPEWLYALLTASLGSSMQESNRKWLGAWIMRSNFQADRSEGMLHLLRSAFLPWVVQGSLFTTSLKKSEGRMRCFHGERLAAYVECLLRNNVEDATFTASLLDTMLDTLTGRKSNIFAYAVVYLLEGIGNYVENNPNLILNQAQLQKIILLSSSTTVPEVARDCILVRCSKIYHTSSQRSSRDLPDSTPTLSMGDWQSIYNSLPTLTPDTIDKLGTPIAVIHSQKSSRDRQEAAAMLKCQDLQKLLMRWPREHSADDLNDALQDIWSDVEYVEYPKRLVVTMPRLVLHGTVMNLAIRSEALRSTVVDIVLKLQALAATRVYIFSPLVCSMRSAILSSSDAAAILPVQDFVTGFAQSLPEPTIDFRLEDATTYVLTAISPALQNFGYQFYFGDRESLGFAALLDLVSRLGAALPEVVQNLLDGLLGRWLRQKTPPPTVSPWKSALQLHIMLLCCEVVIPETDASDMEHLVMDLHYILSVEPLPRYRYLLAWIIARCYYLHAGLQSRILRELRSTDHHSNPKSLASLMKIAVMLACVDGAKEEFAVELSIVCIPLAASSKVVIRHEAQWQIPRLMQHARAVGWTSVTDSAAFIALDEYIRSFERFDDPPSERLLDRLDPVMDHTFTNLVEGKWYGLDNIEVPLCSHSDFVELYRRDVATQHSIWPEPCMSVGPRITHPTSPPIPTKDIVQTTLPTSEVDPGTSSSFSRALQTKGTAYLQDLGVSGGGPQRNDIIVIASLVDNPYNLGGLSRVSEIFGVREIHLQNRNVVGNKDFANVAVSSHLHLDICQLSAATLPAYLVEKKGEGYAVVGIEQTDRSKLLGSSDCDIPEKCILVIGSEKEGIPALVLGECDLLVEIPQQGVTRSLNVQTAAAIVLYEYARQHRGMAS